MGWDFGIGECFCQSGMGGGEGGHFQDAPGRFGADDVAAVEQQFVLQGAGRVAQPLDAQTTEHAVEDHGEEIVDERGIPFFEELAFEIAVVGDEFLAAHLWNRQRAERRARCRARTWKRAI